LILAAMLAGMSAAAPAQSTAAPAPAGPAERRAPTGADDGFQGYDFGKVVATMESSVNPLQREMGQSFRVFVESIESAERMLDEGRTQEAVQEAAAALDVVLGVRDSVLGPMWDGQQMLTEQIATVRARLARAVAAANRGTGPVQLDEPTEVTLDALARRVSDEPDPLRKKRLVAHYRTVRNLARIKAMAIQLSPDQRKMWMSVLGVLDEAALAHQQVMMGSEVLFAQFEATSENLRAYLSLMNTVDGAARLIEVVRGADERAAGMTGFADSMIELQQRLAGFNESVERALEGRMIDLESQLELMEPIPGELAGPGATLTIEEDFELAERMARVSGRPVSTTPGDSR
jgi:hypothetical protein